MTTWIAPKRLFAVLAALPYAGWEFLHWWFGVDQSNTWSFGLGFASAALIFGFWSPVARLFPDRVPNASLAEPPAPREPLPAEIIMNQQQQELAARQADRKQKAAERIALYRKA